MVIIYIYYITIYLGQKKKKETIVSKKCSHQERLSNINAHWRTVFHTEINNNMKGEILNLFREIIRYTEFNEIQNIRKLLERLKEDLVQLDYDLIFLQCN